MNFGTRPGFTPDIELPSNPFRALPDSRQAPVPGPRALLEYAPVNAFSIVSNPQAKVTLIVADFGFDVAGMRVAESVSQHLAADPVNLVLKGGRQDSWRSFDSYIERPVSSF